MVEQTANSHKASNKRKPALKAQKKRGDSKHPFRAEDGAAASIAMEHQSASVTRARRTSVVAIVKKRVEMLNMNVISREFPQLVSNDMRGNINWELRDRKHSRREVRVSTSP